MTTEREYRGNCGALLVEQRADAQEVIVGYAAVYNADSVDLGYFTEVIRPGAFKRAIDQSQDVRALLDHQTGKIVGRTKAGNLSLSEDQTGLRVELTPIDTEDGRTAIEWVRSGVVDGFSFGFQTVSDNWGTKNGRPYRELLDVNLFEVSLVAFPAYPSTSAGLRSEHIASAESVWRDREKVEKLAEAESQRKRAAFERRLRLLLSI